jgi:hypothetical protein
VELKGEAGSEVSEWESGVGAAKFCGPCVCVSVCFCCCSIGCCVRDCRRLGLCKVGVVGWTAGDECVGGRGSLVTGWRRMEG